MDSKVSVTGNRTPVSRVTGGDTSHYTMTDLLGMTALSKFVDLIAMILVAKR